MKRTLSVIAIMMAILAPLAAAVPGLQAGTGVYFESSSDVEGFDLCIWGLKLDARFNVLNGWLSFETPFAFGFDEDIVELSIGPGALMSVPVGSRLRLDAGLGTRMKLTLHTDGTWMVNGTTYDLTGAAFKTMRPDLRAGIIFDIGSISMRLSLRIPTAGTFADLDFDPDWDEAEVGAVMLVDVA